LPASLVSAGKLNTLLVGCAGVGLCVEEELRRALTAVVRRKLAGVSLAFQSKRSTALHVSAAKLASYIVVA
jgi:hypothetical protein